MSMGHGARCRKLDEDPRSIFYEYTCYNVNLDNWKMASETFDGSLFLKKEAVAPSGSGKNGEIDADLSLLLQEGKIEICNCSHAWQTWEGRDVMALRLLRKILQEYQKTGTFPKQIQWHS